MNSLGAWRPLLESEFQKEYFKTLEEKVDAAYAAGTPKVFPPQSDLFRAFHLAPPSKVKLILTGQDPYPTQGHAHGLCFSVRPDVEIPRSLHNIFKELHDDLGCPVPDNGCLEKWAREGVLLLNSTLTVEEGKPGSHEKFGWHHFTKAILEKSRELPQPVAFILWGAKAQKTAQDAHVTDSVYPRICISSPHPSPLGAYRGFWGSKPFSRANQFLLENGSEPIMW